MMGVVDIPQESEDSSDSSETLTSPGLRLSIERLYSLKDVTPGNIIWSHLTYNPDTLPEKYTAIVDSSGAVIPGQILCILGPVCSACDSIPYILAGKNTKYSGEIKIYNPNVTLIEDLREFDGHFVDGFTVGAMIKYYASVMVPRDAGTRTKLHRLAMDLLREFDLHNVRKLKCSQLSRTNQKLLYIVRQLMMPGPTIVLHNPSRYLRDDHCQALGKRLVMMTSLMYSVVICSSNIPGSLFKVCNQLLVYHQTGKSLYYGAPNEFNSYMSMNGVGKSSDVSDTQFIYQAATMRETQFDKIPRPAEKNFTPYLPDHQHKEPYLLPANQFGPLLSRCVNTIMSDSSCSMFRFLVYLCYIIYISMMFRSSKGEAHMAFHATVLVDIMLAFFIGCSLCYSFIAARKIDIVIAKEQIACRYGFSAVINARLMIIVLDAALVIPICALAIAAANLHSLLNMIACVLYMFIANLIYNLIATALGTFECKDLIVQMLIFLYTVSLMLAINQKSKHSLFYWRHISPMFIVKSLILTSSKELQVPENGPFDFTLTTNNYRNAHIVLGVMLLVSFLFYISRISRLVVQKK